MIKSAGVLCIFALLGFGVSPKAYARNVPVCAAWQAGRSSCSTGIRLRASHAMDIMNRNSHLAPDDEGVWFDAVRFTPDLRVGKDSLLFLPVRGSLTDVTGGHNYAAASVDDVSEGSATPVAAVFLARGESDGQLAYNIPSRQGVEPLSEPTGLALFGAGMLLIALLIRRRPVEKTAGDRAHVNASNPPLPVERS